MSKHRFGMLDMLRRMQPRSTPVGLLLSRHARLVSRAFDDALLAAGGSLSTWIVLLNVKAHAFGNQRQLAEAVGLTEATLTHHLNAMESDGLVVRRRDPGNRRVHVIELTAGGEALFARLRDAAIRFDERLRRGLSEPELDALRAALTRMSANVAASDPGVDQDPGDRDLARQ